MRLLHDRVLALVAALAVSLALASCGNGSDDGDGDALTVWTLENLPARMKVQKDIFRDFTEKTGIQVNLVAVAEDQFSQLLSSSAAAGELPDVVGAMTLAGIWEMRSAGLLDAEAARTVVNKLGRETFSARALELVTDQGTPIAVPSDAWVQLLVYRKDLFAKANLDPPQTYAELRRAAKELTSRGKVGITLSTAPDAVFTQQSFEHVALANGCRLLDSAGNVSLNRPECARALDLYAELASQYSVLGSQDVESTRATYFSGKAAMVIWSSFLLDEMAGLREDALPTCEPCRKDPAFLARNSGVVAALQGPSGRPAQFGEVVSWGITSSARTRDATELVTYMMNAGYIDWLGMAPEGKIPVRTGTPKQADKFVEAWRGLEAGVDARKPLSEVYPDDVIETLVNSPDTISRWGLSRGRGALVGAMLGELPVANAVARTASGEVTPTQAAQQAQHDVTSIKSSLD